MKRIIFIFLQNKFKEIGKVLLCVIVGTVVACCVFAIVFGAFPYLIGVALELLFGSDLLYQLIGMFADDPTIYTNLEACIVSGLICLLALYIILLVGFLLFAAFVGLRNWLIDNWEQAKVQAKQNID